MDEAELVRRLRDKHWVWTNDGQAAADAIERLVRERDEARDELDFLHRRPDPWCSDPPKCDDCKCGWREWSNEGWRRLEAKVDAQIAARAALTASPSPPPQT